MPNVESFAGTASGGGVNNNILEDNGIIVRIRDGQTQTLSDFDNKTLSIPSGATIDGIEVILDTADNGGNGENNTGAWIKVNNGSSDSSAKLTTAGNAWDTNFSDGTDIRIAGGTTDLWGLSWTPSTAEGISVIMGWTSTAGSAFYSNYVKVKVYYTEGDAAPTTYNNSSDEQIISKNTVFVSTGLIEF